MQVDPTKITNYTRTQSELEEPPMPDWPEPSADDIEPAPEQPRVDMLRADLRLDLTIDEFVAIESSVKNCLRRYWNSEYRAVFRFEIRLAVKALRALRKYRHVFGDIAITPQQIEKYNRN